MDPVWASVAAAVSALILFGIKLWTSEREKNRKADHAISKRDRDELRDGMARIDGVSDDKPVPPGPQAGV